MSEQLATGKALEQRRKQSQAICLLEGPHSQAFTFD
jgi:hypothetical protein